MRPGRSYVNQNIEETRAEFTCSFGGFEDLRDPRSEMTRYARSKGSKASNEREPEEATPWSEMVASMGLDKRNPEEEEEDEILQEEEESQVKDDEGPMEVDEKVEADKKEDEGKKKSKKRKQDKCLICKEKGHLKRECPELSQERRQELQELVRLKVERKGKGTGRKKSKKTLPEVKPALKTPKPKQPRIDITGKIVNEGETLFQGFRIKEEDLPRLKELESQMREGVKLNKITSKELEETLKKERRRAENDLARSKKMVCYLCRKHGHFLADCPEAEGEKRKKVAGEVGSCFKCGSSDHTSKECESKLKGEAAYRFAICFICKQKGHLAKACPDNPKGLYPKGGGCRFCGSVEHLKSECKRKLQKVEKHEIKIGTLKSGAGIEDDIVTVSVKHKLPHKKTKKVVKF